MAFLGQSPSFEAGTISTRETLTINEMNRGGGFPNAATLTEISSDRPDRAAGADPGTDRGVLGRRLRGFRSAAGDRDLSQRSGVGAGGGRSGRSGRRARWRLCDLLRGPGERVVRRTASDRRRHALPGRRTYRLARRGGGHFAILRWLQHKSARATVVDVRFAAVRKNAGQQPLAARNNYKSTIAEISNAHPFFARGSAWARHCARSHDFNDRP